MSNPESPVVESTTTGITSPTRANRRNGKLASCEPCRKRKTRCDHQQPICARCRRRGLEKQCFYHPAPLTRKGIRDGSPIAFDTNISNPAYQNDAAFSNGQVREEVGNGRAATGPVARTAHSPALNTQFNSDSHEGRVQAVQTLVNQLHHSPLILKLLRIYLATTASCLVPGAFVLPAATDLHDRWTRSQNTTELSRSLAEQILQSTSATIDVHALTSPSDFCLLNHGPNLRLEILGLIYTIAGRACMFQLKDDHADSGELHSTFIQDMFRSSNEALRLAVDLVPEVTDTLIWLRSENLLLTTALRGDVGSATWRRLSEMVCDILLLDLHRESSYASIPFFLAQCRRRMFAAAYHHDKLISTLTDRPPRLLRRFSDTEMPLHLTDDEVLTVDPLEMDQIQRSLTASGWSTGRKFSSSAWARLRFNIAMIREEVLEYPWRQSTPDNLERLRNLSRRSNEQYSLLPSHLQYSADCWDSGIPNAVSFMLTATYLSYRQLDFQIFRLLEKSDPESLLPLLQVSEDIVATVLHVGALRTRASFLAQDFAFLILTYGLPSAAVLTTALERAAIPRVSTLPSTWSRSVLIRKLTVFVSMLESLQALSGTRKSLSIESANAISRTIDKVLDSTESPFSSETTPTARPLPNYDPAGSGAALVSVSSAPAQLTSDIDSLFPNRDGLELFELPDWANTIDWTNMGNDWMTL